MEKRDTPPARAIDVADDLRIARDARHELRLDERVDGEHISLRVENGTVGLTGVVCCLDEKVAARQAVARVAGVREIVNDLEVRIPDAQHRNDTDLARVVRRALESCGGGVALHVRATVCDGWVTLEGAVDREGERDAAGREVTRLSGVTGVTNAIVAG